MGGQHAHAATPETVRMRRVALAVVVPLALLTLVALVAMWPDPIERDMVGAADQHAAEITAIDAEPCPEQLSDEVNGCGTATVTFSEGERAGEEIEVALPNGPGAPRIAEGEHVWMITMASPDGESWSIVDHQRTSQLWILLAAFALAVIAFGRLRGASSLAGLAVTFAVILYFFVPAILGGQQPLLVAMVACAAIVLVVLYLTHGFTLVTTVAVLGTIVSLAFTGALGIVTVAALHLSGVTDDISAAVGMTHGVNMEGLLLASIMIGSVGVLDDVTVTQAATVQEIARANPDYRVGDLYRAGERVGRAHIASVINTIILAYAGSSLPLLILIVANNDSLGGVLTDQVIAQEIVRSAVATLGLVAAVPLTTALAAVAARRAGREGPPRPVPAH